VPNAARNPARDKKVARMSRVKSPRSDCKDTLTLALSRIRRRTDQPLAEAGEGNTTGRNDTIKSHCVFYARPHLPFYLFAHASR
jgi:hypothetical protein